MKPFIRSALISLSLLISHGLVSAAPAIEVLGKDYSFPHKLTGLPTKLSDFQDLQINAFTTSDGLTYIEKSTAGGSGYWSRCRSSSCSTC